MNTKLKGQRINNRAQTLLLFTFFMIVLILFVGLGVDLGFVYIARARLSKGVDAACLTGIRNYYLGQDQAKNIAISTFHANAGSTNTPSIEFRENAFRNVIIDVSATETINTFFIRVLPQWKSLTVGSAAQATRAKAVMTLVLDRSGSMIKTTGGAIYLPDAVIRFINYFDDNIDKAAVATFASTATLNIPMEQPFKNDVIGLANALKANWTGTPSIGWAGGTFAQGGLTNGLVQTKSVPVAVGEDVIKAVVFFTDGRANMIQATLNCPPATPWNFGGQDEDHAVWFWKTNTPLTRVDQDNPTVNGYGCVTSGGTPSCCGGTSQFRSVDGSMKTFLRENVTLDATQRCFQVANEMRDNNMYVYAIGMGTAEMDFLAQVANATNSPTYNPDKKTGLAFKANDPAELTQLFDKVANDILFRLTK